MIGAIAFGLAVIGAGGVATWVTFKVTKAAGGMHDINYDDEEQQA